MTPTPSGLEGAICEVVILITVRLPSHLKGHHRNAPGRLPCPAKGAAGGLTEVVTRATATGMLVRLRDDPFLPAPPTTKNTVGGKPLKQVG